MKSYICVLTLLLFISPYGFSQDQWSTGQNIDHNNDAIIHPIPLDLDCSNSSSDYQGKYNRYSFYSDNYDKHPIVTIPINLIFWQKDDGSDNWQNNQTEIERLDKVINWLNGFYGNNCNPSDPVDGVQELPDTKIRFAADYYFHQNSSMWSSISSSSLNAEFNNLNPNSPKRLNIHVTGGSFSNAAGFAAMPSTNLNQTQYIVTFNNEANPVSDYSWAQHLAHELGHSLDLKHTYSGGGASAICNINNPDYLWDVFGNGTCPHNAQWNCDPFDQNNTCTNNIMGATQNACYFSPLQIAKMHRAIALKSIRNYVLCEDYIADPIIVSSNEEWDFNIKFYNPITIKSGAHLKITCHVEMASKHKIAVEQNARLTINGAHVTSKCGLWSGIEVWGNNNLSQTPSNQGYLITSNDATIENAKNAIRTIKQNGIMDWSKTGGIVQCSNTLFLNNWRSVEYLYYHSSHPSLPGIEIMNKGRFNNCEFVWNDDYTYFNVESAITMFHVNGIQISGCDFRDERNTTERASGIKSIDAGYKVLGRYTGGGIFYPPNFPQHNYYDETDYDVCYFHDLKYGIHAMNSSTLYPIFVDHSKFENNKYGIVLDGNESAVITRNKFDFNTDYPNDLTSMYQLSLRECTGYRVEGNNFYRNINLGASGVLVDNSGPQENEIYRNYYEGLSVGNWGRGFNSNDLSNLSTAFGLQWKCNENVGGVFDLLNSVNSTTSYGEGVRLLQGSPYGSAGNLFSPNLSNNGKHINSNDLDFLTYYHGILPNETPIELQGLVGTTTTSLSYCPSTFTNKIVVDKSKLITDAERPSMHERLSSNNEAILSLTSELNGLLAEGDAQSLHDMVEGLTPQNKFAVRNALNDASPFLSQSLLEELGEKNVSLFPHSWYKSIVEANIEVARNDDFMESLLNEPSPLPIGMYKDIQKIRFKTFTARGEIEILILKMKNENEILMNLFVSDAMSSENEINWGEVKELIIERDHIEFQRQVADFYLSRRDIDNCNSMMDLIESQLSDFGMERIKREMEDYIFLKRYLLSITNNTGIIYRKLLPNELAQLEYMATNFESKSARQARNLLCFHANRCEDIEYVIPRTRIRAHKNGITTGELNRESKAEMQVVPNPNNGTFKLILPENHSFSKISVVDISGKKIEFETLSEENHQMSIKLFNENQGIYFVTIQSQDGSIFTKRSLVTID